MQLLVENTVDAAKEKHVPVIEKVDGGVKVKVGDVAHPMEEKHYIEWIEIIADGKPSTPFMSYGDTIRVEMFDQQGDSIFGAIEQKIVRYDS